MKNESGLSKFTSNCAELGVHYHTSALASDYAYDNLLFVKMLNGNKEIELHNGGEVSINPEDLLMISTAVSATVRCNQAEEFDPSVCLTLEVDNGRVENILDRINECYGFDSSIVGECKLHGLNHYEVQKSKSLSDVIGKIRELHLNDSRFKDKLVEIAIEELVVKTLQTDFSNQLLHNFSVHLNSNPLAFAADYIQKNIRSRINIDDLADQAYMSRATFYRQFRLCFGISPLTYIKQERIKLACRELLNSQRTVSSISYDLGYTNPSYFVKQFKELMGVSPQVFRRDNSQTKA